MLMYVYSHAKLRDLSATGPRISAQTKQSMVRDTDNLHLSKEFLSHATSQADTCTVSLEFSTHIRTEDSRQVVCVDLYGLEWSEPSSHELKVTSKPKPASPVDGLYSMNWHRRLSPYCSGLSK